MMLAAGRPHSISRVPPRIMPSTPPLNSEVCPALYSACTACARSIPAMSRLENTVSVPHRVMNSTMVFKMSSQMVVFSTNSTAQ